MPKTRDFSLQKNTGLDNCFDYYATYHHHQSDRRKQQNFLVASKNSAGTWNQIFELTVILEKQTKILYVAYIEY